MGLDQEEEDQRGTKPKLKVYEPYVYPFYFFMEVPYWLEMSANNPKEIDNCEDYDEVNFKFMILINGRVYDQP